MRDAVELDNRQLLSRRLIAARTAAAGACFLTSPGNQCTAYDIRASNGYYRESYPGLPVTIHDSRRKQHPNLIGHQGSNVRQAGHVNEGEHRPAPAVCFATDHRQGRRTLGTQGKEHHN